ncbi:type II secretion system protein [Planctomycetales bacterium ZRK34]|nr:type II secretion system protein [Planctomycetales bacterium ZRK34]
MRHRGFTLIELLVVVSIIALLIAILMPSLAKARATARMITCSSILKQFGTTTQMYAAEFRGWMLPQSTPSPAAYKGRYVWHQNPWFQKVMAMGAPKDRYYYNAPRGLICPNARWVLDHPAGDADRTRANAAPTVVDFANGMYRIDLSYAMNPYGIPKWRIRNDDGTDGGDQSHLIVRGIKQVDVKNPSRKYYMMDSMWTDPIFQNRFLYVDNPDATFLGPANNWTIAWRHFYIEKQSGLCNVLHYDTHVESLGAGVDPDLPMNDYVRWNADM